MDVIDIGYLQLLLALGFVLLAGISSLALHLNLHRDILWGTVRTVCQLFLMGYILRHVFRLASPLPVLLIFAGMIFFAGRIIAGRVTRTGPCLLWGRRWPLCLSATC